MTCNRFRTLIQQRFDQDLSTQDHRALINHLEGCESCAKFDHQLDQMIQAAQDTPAPDEVRPQNPEALARLIMEQLPQKKGSVVNMIMGLFGGGGGGKPKAPKQPKEQKVTSSLKGDAVRGSKPKGKGKDKGASVEMEQDRRPAGAGFGKKTAIDEQDEIDIQVGTFSRLKSISAGRDEREAQSTTRSLGEKFGVAGISHTMEGDGPLTLAESIKRKVSESQKMSPVEDDFDASGSIAQAAGGFGREAAGGGNWGPPSFASQGQPGLPGGPPAGGGQGQDWGNPAAGGQGQDWGGAGGGAGGGNQEWTGGGGAPGGGQGQDWGAPPKPTAMPGQTFGAPGPIGLDEHPGSAIGLAPPGQKRPTAEQTQGGSKMDIGLAPATPAPGSAAPTGSTGIDWGAPKEGAAGSGGNWGATQSSQGGGAQGGSGWTSGWGGEGSSAAPLKSSDSWAIPGSESTNSWGQPSEAPATNFAGPAPAQEAPKADPWAPSSGNWGGGQAEGGQQQDAWGGGGQEAAASAPAPAPAQADAWGGAPAEPQPAQQEAWGETPAAPAPAQQDAWGSAPAQPAQQDAWGSAPAQPAQQDAWGSAPAQPAQSEGWGASPAPPAPAQSEGWGATPAPAAAPAQAEGWGATPAAPAAQGDVWGAQPASQNSAWGAQPAAPAATAGMSEGWGSTTTAPGQAAPAAAQADAWGTPATAQNSAWGAAPAAPAAAAPAPAPAEGGWGAAPPAGQSAAWGTPPAVPAQATPDWGGAPTTAPTTPITDVAALAVQYSTIPPGQFATPSNAGNAIANSTWGGTPSSDQMDPAKIEAKKSAWAQEAEQLETGTWKAFTPKTTDTLGKPTALPTAGAAPGPAPGAPPGERWDVPIQERMKTGDQPAAPVMPIQPAPAAAQQRWDVPIQERGKEGETAPPAAPAAAAPVMSSGIPVNQIVEKMGQVLGGGAAAGAGDGQESRWDVPIQERMKAEQQAQAPAEAPAAAPAPAPTAAWGQPAEAAAPAASGWGQPTATAASGWGQQAPEAPVAQAAPATDNSWGSSNSSWGQEPAAAPAAPGWNAQPAAGNGGWGSGEAAAAPAANNGGWGEQPAQPAASWGQPAGSSWGEQPAQAPAAAPQQAAPAASGWGDTAASGGGWGQAPAAAASGWGTAPATPQAQTPPPPTPAAPTPAPVAAEAPPAVPEVKPEVTDKVAGGGLLQGIDDRAIDKIFGEIGVQESVHKGLVNSGAEPVANFSPPATPAPEPMAAPVQAAAPAAFAPPPAAQPAEVPKAGLLGGIDDSAIDKIFSQNLGVSEASVPVGQMAAAGAVANNWAQTPPVAAAAPAAEPASGGWGAPPAASGWGQPPAAPAPSAPVAPVAESAPAAASGGWGMAPTAAPSQWGQPPQAESGPPKLFSVDDMAMDKIFETNLGIKDGQMAANANDMGAPQAAAAPMAMPAPAPAPVAPPPAPVAPEVPFQSGPPPKIEGIGRLDSGSDPNQDGGSGRIASIGKFLLDQKDLDKIGKLTNTDFNESKLRILTKENSDDLQALLGQIGTQKGVVGSVIVGHDGLLIANTMPGDMDAESVGVWALGVYMNTEHVTKKMGHERVHQVVSRTPRGYVIIADFGGGLLVTVTEGKDTDSLIPLMRTITQLVN